MAPGSEDDDEISWGKARSPGAPRRGPGCFGAGGVPARVSENTGGGAGGSRGGLLDHLEELIGLYVLEDLPGSPGPANLDLRGRRRGPEAEMEADVALRKVARSLPDLAGLPPLAPGGVPRPHPDAGADAVAVAPRPLELQRQPVPGPITPVVAEELGPAVVVDDEEIDVAVVVDIGDGEAAADVRRDEGVAQSRPDLVEAPLAVVLEKGPGLEVGHLGAAQPDVVDDVPVGDEEVQVAVVVVVEKGDPEPDAEEAGLGESGLERRVGEGEIAVVDVQLVRLVVEGRHDQIHSAVLVDVPRVGPHARLHRSAL